MAGEEVKPHSLKMQIEADFGIAANNANEFEGYLNKLDKVVEDADKKISSVTTSKEKLEQGIKKSLNDILGDFNKGLLKLNGDDLTTAIEKRVADAITQKGILIENLTNNEPLKVKVSKEVSDRLRDSLGEELATLAGNVDLSGLSKRKMKINMNSDAALRIQQLFNDKLQKTLSENISFESSDTEILDTFHVSKDSMNNLLKRVRERFFEILNDPLIVQVDDTKLTPIRLDSDILQGALEKVKAAIGNIDDQFAPDIMKQIGNLPNIKDKILLFQQHTASLFTELEQTIDAIDKLNPEEKNFNRLKYEAGRMRNMIIDSGTDIIRQINLQFENSVGKNADNSAVNDAVASLDGIRSHINKYIKVMADSAYDAMVSQLNIEKKQMGNREFFAPSLQQLQQKVIEASREALKNLTAGDMKIDVDNVKMVFDSWATQTSQQLMANAVTSLGDLQKTLIEKNQTVMDRFVKSLMRLADIEFKPTNQMGEKITVKIDEVDIRKKIQDNMRGIAETLTSQIDFTPGAKKALDSGLMLTKKQTDKIQSSVAIILQDQLGKLSEQLGKRSGVDFNESVLEGFDKQLFNEAKNLVTSIVDQANNISRAITEGINSSGFKSLGSEEQNEIRERFKLAGEKMISDFSSMMDNALSSFVVASSVTEQVKNGVQKKLDAIVGKTDVNFDDAKTPIVLHGVVADVQRELQSVVKSNIEAWEPDLKAFSPDINFKSVFDNISKAINSQLDRTSNDIIGMVNEQSSKLKNSDATKFIEAESATKGDMTLYSKRELVGDDLKKVEEYGFGFLAEGERGFEYKLWEPDKLTDEFFRIMTELNNKFTEEARKESERVRNENINVSKQGITSALSPVREGVELYLKLYADAVGDAIKSIKPSAKGVADKFKNTVLTDADSKQDAPVKLNTKGLVDSVSSSVKDLSFTPVVSSKDLHADVRKLFANEFDGTVKEWEKANPSFEGESGIGKVMEKNIQAIMNKFHKTVAHHTKEAISHYGDELDKVDTKPRTESVNHLALALGKLQSALDGKLQDWITSQFGSLTEFLQNYDFRRTSIGAPPSEVNIEGTNSRVNYGQGLPFPEFEGEGGTVRPSIGFDQTPAGDWFSQVRQDFDPQWQSINEWVNQRLLDGLRAKNKFKGKIPADLQEHLFDYIDNQYTPSVKDLGSTPYDPEDKEFNKWLRQQMTYVEQDLRLAIDTISSARNEQQLETGDASFEISRENTEYQLDRFQGNGIVPQERIDDVRLMIDNATTANDLKKIRQELRSIRDLQSDMKRDQEKEKKQGTLLTQNVALRENANLQAQSLQGVLRTVPALRDYNVEQLRINNATNSWSARLRDANGNVRSLQGTVDRATGSLYQHSEAISQVVSQSNRLASMSGNRYGGGGGGYVTDRYYPGSFNNNNVNEHNPNGDFTSSVWNTMRYMTAGALMGAPTMMLWDAWEANKEFDYQMERARQNFIIKGDLNNRMGDVAEKRVLLENPGIDLSSNEGKETLEAERQRLLGLAGEDSDVAKRKVENIALDNIINIQDAAKSYHISSRLLDDPNDAFAMAQAVSKAYSIEELDIETGTKGMEAIASQWGTKGGDFDDIMNMLIMAANYSPATVEDLLATQQRSGSIFRENLPQMTKREGIAASIGLSSMFTQATARSGKEGGTFFKTILQKPFTAKGAKELQGLALQKGFEDLNPYNEDGSQKDFVTLFSSIMEHSANMGTKDKKDLWASIFPQWHQGSAGAIEAFMNDMVEEMQENLQEVKTKRGQEADLDNDGEISVKEAFTDYFNNIENYDPKAIEEMREGNADTWGKQIQKLITMVQATMRGVFDDLKDEFGMLANYLMTYMRAVRDNTEMVSAAINIGSKLAMGAGVRYAYGKISDRVQESANERNREKFEEAGNYLLEERRAHNLQRIATEDGLSIQENRRTAINRRREAISGDRQQNNDSLLTLRNDVEDKKQRRQELISSHNLQNGVDNSDSIRQLDQDIIRLNRDINALEQSTSDLDNELADLQRQEDEVDSATRALNEELDEQNRSMRTVNNRIEALADAMDDMGLEGQQLRSQVERLSQEFQTGATDINRYETQLSEVAERAGVSDRQLTKLREEVDQLNREFKEGTIQADQYVDKIKELERAHRLGSLGIEGGGVGGAGTTGQSGMGLMEMVIAGSLLAGGGKMARGIFQRVGDWRRTGDIRTAFGRGGAMTNNARRSETLLDRNGQPIHMGDVLAEDRARTPQGPKKWYQKGIFGKIGSVASKAGALKGVLPFLKTTGWTMVAGEAAMKGFDLVSSAFMEDFEKKDIQADKLDELNVQAQNLKHGNLGQKLLGGLTMAGDLTFGSLNNLFGGNEASFGQVWKALTTKSDSKEDLQAKLDDEFKTKGLREEAKDLEDEYLQRTDPDYKPLEESLDELTEEEREAQEALEDLTSALGELNATMSRSLGMNQAQYTIDSTKLLLSGVRSDSQQMRDLMKDLLEKNNEVLQQTLTELQSKMANVSDKESDVYKDMESQEKELQAQLIDNNYKIRQNNLSEVDSIMNRLQEDLATNEDEYGIKQNQAVLGGAADDSPVLKKIETSKVESANGRIEQAQTELSNLLTKLNLKENDSDYIKIQNAIKDLEKQQLDNLVAIKSNLDKQKGTFNLPSGVKVTDYMSHMMSKNTHRNVTTRMGDTIVNVTIDKMSGSANDVQRVTDKLADAIRLANQQNSKTFNGQVWAGMGSGYTSAY